MTAEQQLERSVLESKERDELHAIAQALSVKTTTRTKKADIIDGILQAAGVPTSDGGANGGGDAPASNEAPRSRSRRTRSAKAEADVSTDDSGSIAPGGDDAPAPDSRPERKGLSFAPDDGVDISARVDLDDEFPDLISTPGSQGRQGAAGEEGATEAGQNNQGRNNQNNQAGPGNRNNQGNHNNQGGAQDDFGNRRSNRRRRGRERGVGPDGDLQGGSEQPYQGELIPVRGLLDLRDEGYGFLRTEGYLASPKDVYVSVSQARRLALRKGDAIEGACRPAGPQEKFAALLQIDKVSGLDPEVARLRPRFEDLTPLFPDEKLHLEMPGEKENLTARIVDLLSPIGKGQRGLIVSPPKAGKTTVMKHIAHSIEANNPDVHLMVLLVDERPEEVTDMRRSVKGEVVASTFDRPSEEHTAVAELAIERAKRLVEAGQDVVIILDGITRLARAYNLAHPATGRIMSGGVDSGALYPPKKFFGAARNIEEGGSLTILATALVETGSKMDEVIFEEFKGTGNMELRLDRRLAERRLYPSIDVNASSTRHEELLFDRSQLQQVWKLRRVLNALANEGSAAAGLELLMDKIRTTKSNDEFLAEIAKGPAT